MATKQRLRAPSQATSTGFTWILFIKDFPDRVETLIHEIFENFAPQIPEKPYVVSETIHESQQGNRVGLPEMNSLNKVQSHPNLAAHQSASGVPVPNYNTQRPRVQNKKTWWRWDFVRRWRKLKAGGAVKGESKPATDCTGATVTRDRR